MKDSRIRSIWWPVLLPLALVLILLTPTSQAQEEEPPVMVTVDVAGSLKPGTTAKVTANVEINDGSTLESYDWTQTGGLDARLRNVRSPTCI